MEFHPVHYMSRRELLGAAVAAGSVSLVVEGSAPLRAESGADAPAEATGAAPRPFRVDIPQATVDRILNRVRDTRWPDRLEANDWRYGANWDYMKALAEYWTTQFDWRKAEANLNRYPQFLARIGEFDVHFYHVKGRGPKPVPLVLTHGWPGSVFEFLEAIGPLTDPASFGGSAEDAFDVVVPSVPGFGFSSKPKGKPIGLHTTATLWNQLMTEVLGYPKYASQGGDVGSGVTNQLAHQFPDSLIGVRRRSILHKASSRETSIWCTTRKCREVGILRVGNSRNCWSKTCANFSGSCEPDGQRLNRLRKNATRVVIPRRVVRRARAGNHSCLCRESRGILRFLESGGSRLQGLSVSPTGVRKPELHRSPKTGPRSPRRARNDKAKDFIPCAPS